MFMNGLFTGLAFGIMLMFVWRSFMRRVRHERLQKAIDNASLAAVTKPESIEEIIGFFPKWIQFSEFEQVEWLNQALKEMWPFVNQAVKGTIVEVVEPMLVGYTSAAIPEIQFTRTDLGSNAPEFRGVKVHTWEANQVVLDLDLSWQGNCKFKLAITTATRVPVKPCITNLSFAGTIRVILELTDKVPVIAAYMYAINRKAEGDHYSVKFDLTGAGLGAIPGLQKQIDGTIHSILDNMMLWPRRQAAALIPGYDISHLELLYTGEVIVTVVKGDNLKNVDTLGKSDPRVVLFIDKNHQFATPVIDNSLNPVWAGQTFRIPVDDVLTATLYIRVEDEDASIVTDWDEMGFSSLPLADVMKVEKETTWTLELYNDFDSARRTKEELGTITIKAIYRGFIEKEERQRVTESEKNWKPKELSSAMPLAEAADAVKKAEEDAQERARNLALLRGVGHAADKLVNLHKDKLAPALKAVAAMTPQKPAPGPNPVPAAAAATGAISAAPAAQSAISAAPAASAAISAASSGRFAPSVIAPAPGPTPAVGASGRGFGSSLAAGPPPEGAAAAAAIASAPVAASFQGLDGSLPSPSGGSDGAPDGADSAAALVAPPSPAHSTSGPLDEERHVRKREKVTEFFKGMGSTLKLKRTGSGESMTGESPARDVPLTPSSSRGKSSGLLGGFGRKKPSAEA